MEATPRKVFAPVCPSTRPKAAKAGLRSLTDALMFECVERVQRRFELSGDQMAGLLGLTQSSNYSRRKYNISRIARLEKPMRDAFLSELAGAIGMQVATPTNAEQVFALAKATIISLLDVMETLERAS